MNAKIKQLLEKSGFKNIALLSSGVLLAQLLSIAAQPVVTRIYTAADLGVFATITATVGNFVGVVNGQYDLSIVSAGSDKEADHATALSLYVGIFLSVVLGIGILLAYFFAPALLGNGGAGVLISIPILLLSAVINVLNSYNNRYGDYKLLTGVTLRRSVVMNGARLVLGFCKTGTWGLVISYFLSFFAGMKKQAGRLWENRKQIFSTSRAELKAVAKRYRAQPLFSAPAVFVTSYSVSILVYLIGAKYGNTELGFYNTGISLLWMPISLVSANVGKVFFQNASREKAEKGNFYSTFKSTSILLAVASIIPFVALWFCAEPLLGIFLGKAYVRAGTFMKILLPLYWVRFIVTSVASGLIISGRQLGKLVLQALFIVEALVAYGIAEWFSLDIEGFLQWINLLYLLNSLAVFWFVYRASKQQDCGD